MEVWPKGKFVFSPELGFQGEAERITLKGVNQAALNKRTIAQDKQQTEAAIEISGMQQYKTAVHSKDTAVESTVS